MGYIAWTDILTFSSGNAKIHNYLYNKIHD